MAKATKILAVALCSTLIFTGCSSTGSGQTLTVGGNTSKAESAKSTASTNLGMRDKDTFDKGTKDYNFDGITISVPTAFTTDDPTTSDDITFDISDNNKLEMQSMATSIKDSTDQVIINEIIKELIGYVPSTESTPEVQATNIKQFTVGDFDALSFEAAVPDNNDYDDVKNINSYVTYVINTKSDTLDLIILAEADTARYSYKNDYYKIIDSMKA